MCFLDSTKEISRFAVFESILRYGLMIKIVANASPIGTREVAAVLHGSMRAPNPNIQPITMIVIGAVIKQSGVSA